MDSRCDRLGIDEINWGEIGWIYSSVTDTNCGVVACGSGIASDEGGLGGRVDSKGLTAVGQCTEYIAHRNSRCAIDLVTNIEFRGKDTGCILTAAILLTDRLMK